MTTSSCGPDIAAALQVMANDLLTQDYDPMDPDLSFPVSGSLAQNAEPGPSSTQDTSPVRVTRPRKLFKGQVKKAGDPL